MLKPVVQTKFKKDLKKVEKKGLNLKLLALLIDEIAAGKLLDPKYNDHRLRGNYNLCRECHIEPDWLLIYKIENERLYLVRTGTHSDLFNK